MMMNGSCSAFSATHQAHTVSSELHVPKIFKQVMAGPRKEEWEEVCQEEAAAHMENSTWQLAEHPSWTLLLDKARLVVESFAPII